MKKTIFNFTLGFITCLILFLFLYFYKSKKEEAQYFILKEDYNISIFGKLNKGAKIKFDQEMHEGFSRFILYLNLKNGNVVKSNESNAIIPYWLHEVDTIFTPTTKSANLTATKTLKASNGQSMEK